MTISYSGNFLRLLFRWRGSIWRATYPELCCFLTIYFMISFVYRILLKDDPGSKETFEQLCLMFDDYTKYIPLTFLLGFYINAIVTRWWRQFELVVWPDELVSYINFIIPEDDEAAEEIRHQIVRYLCLSCTLAWRDISGQVRRRFPTMEHVVISGLITPSEMALNRQLQAELLEWQQPICWIQNIVRRRYADGKIAAPLVGGFLKQLNDFRASCRKLYCFDWVCIPLAYTQVTALATYGYFVLCLLGRQFLDPSKKYPGNNVDFYIPFFTILQFLFLVGWFKVGQDLMRPFGLDDDDIELNYILDRHLKACFAMARSSHQEPPFVKDRFWKQDNPTLPNTKMSAKQRHRTPKLHAHIRVNRFDDVHLTDTPADVAAMETAKIAVNELTNTVLRSQHKPAREF